MYTAVRCVPAWNLLDYRSHRLDTEQESFTDPRRWSDVLLQLGSNFHFDLVLTGAKVLADVAACISQSAQHTPKTKTKIVHEITDEALSTCARALEHSKHRDGL